MIIILPDKNIKEVHHYLKRGGVCSGKNTTKIIRSEMWYPVKLYLHYRQARSKFSLSNQKSVKMSRKQVNISLKSCMRILETLCFPKEWNCFVSIYHLSIKNISKTIWSRKLDFLSRNFVSFLYEGI